MRDPVTLPPLNILDALPHRPPFRFLTSVSVLEPEASGEAVWYVDGTESFFAGHFPGRPIVPGVLIAEALAQLSGLIGFLFSVRRCGTEDRADLPIGEGKLAHADVRFKEVVVPPAEVLLRSRMVRTLGALRQFEVEARCDGHLVARGRLTLVGNTNPAAPVEVSCKTP